jgi:prevent-host-death family protein
MTSITITDARKKLYKLIEQVHDSHEPVIIAGKQNSGVLISQEDFNAIQETLYLQAIPGMTKSIVKGMKTDIKECSKELDW